MEVVPQNHSNHFATSQCMRSQPAGRLALMVTCERARSRWLWLHRLTIESMAEETSVATQNKRHSLSGLHTVEFSYKKTYIKKTAKQHLRGLT